jgi:hypothetical protein
MPISRNEVRRLCTGAEYEVYGASLRKSIAELPPSKLRAYIIRAQDLIRKAGGTVSSRLKRVIVRRRGKGGPMAGALRQTLRKEGYLFAALSRFESRLRVLREEETLRHGGAAGGRPAKGK